MIYRGWGKKDKGSETADTASAMTNTASGPAGGPLKTPTAGTTDQSRPGETAIDMTKTAEIKGQLNEVTNIMSQNIEDAKARGGKMDDMAKQAEDLELGSKQFNTNTGKVKKNLFLKNMKMTIYLTIVVLIILAIIIGVIVWQMKS